MLDIKLNRMSNVALFCSERYCFRNISASRIFLKYYIFSVLLDCIHAFITTLKDVSM